MWTDSCMPKLVTISYCGKFSTEKIILPNILKDNSETHLHNAACKSVYKKMKLKKKNP